MLERIEHLAEVSVARGCGFAALAIVTFMLGLADQMDVSCKAGGILALGACLVLALRGCAATAMPYKRTEVWVMLKSSERPQPAVAQQIIGNALRRVYLRFALHAAIVSATLFGLSFLLRLLGSAA
jgi:hypothetical protein